MKRVFPPLKTIKQNDRFYLGSYTDFLYVANNYRCRKQLLVKLSFDLRNVSVV